MILNTYGVTLEKIKETDIELVREWRNDHKISQYMDFRDYITPEMQKRWFHSIDNSDNYYFIIHYKNEKIGLADLKKINWEFRHAESGIFVYIDKYQNSSLPYQVIFSLFDFSFNELQLLEVYARILKTNKRAIRFNKSLGFQLEPNQDEKTNQLYKATKDSYFNNSEKIKKIVCREIIHE